MKTPKVSIVCISYNHEKFIKDAIEGFLAQETDFDYEIIIADDASSDKTQSIILGYASQHKKIIPILRDSNVGVQTNLIEALTLAKGEYIAICEGDDFWVDSIKLQIQVDFLDNNPDFTICFHKVEVYFENNKTKHYISPDDSLIESSSEVSLQTILSDNIIPTNSVMYRNVFGYHKLNKNVMPLDWYLHAYHAQYGRLWCIDRIMAKNRRHENGVWWASQQSETAIWLKYKYGWIELFEEFSKMFTGSADIKAPIYNNVVNFLNILLKNQTVEEFKEIQEMVDLRPHLSYFYKQWAADRLFGLRDEIIHSSQHSDAQGLVIRHQEEKIRTLTRELEWIKSSRWWRLRSIIKK